MKSKIKKLSLISAAKLLLPVTALASSHDTILIDTPQKVENLLNSVADWLFTIFMIVAVIAIIYSAFLYLTAAGDETKVTKARKALTYAIIAIVIALLAGSIPILLENILRNS